MAEDKDLGAFVPTNFIWDVSEIQSKEFTPESFRELLVRLYQNLNLMQLNLNLKDSAYYDTDEFVNGQQFFPSPDASSSESPETPWRAVVRKAVNFGALPDTATKSVAHDIDITTAYTFTRLYGAASDTTGLTYLPIPNSDINLEVDVTNVKVTTAADLTAYDTTYIVLEYITQ